MLTGAVAQKAAALDALRTAQADACNRLVPVVRTHRLWNRVGLHQRTYNDLRGGNAPGQPDVLQRHRPGGASSVSTITMEDLTDIRERIKAGKRMRGCLHRWAWRQLQSFVEYKAKAAGFAVEYVNPVYTCQTCACCGQLGKRSKHRFVCKNGGLRAHSDLNASRNLGSDWRDCRLANGGCRYALCWECG